MREIKFRGFDGKKFRYGMVVDWSEDDAVIVEMKNKITRRHHVDPDTIAQYTGLFDCNGTDIYENDRVVYEDRDFGFVVWDEESAAFGVEFDAYWLYFKDIFPDQLEVVA